MSFYSPGKRKSTADEDMKTEEMSEKETKKPKVENEEKSEVMETDNDKRYVLNELINCKKHKHAMAIETNSQILLCISSQCCVKF
jgi:murein L,D-transpeptidase YafK